MNIIFTASDGYAGLVLVECLGVARDRLDRAVELIEWAIDLHEQLTWGVFDMDDARNEVAKFKRAVEAHCRGNG
jgi:hypothetical protein